MASRAWFSRALVVLALGVPLTAVASGPAHADHRHGGWHGSGWYDGDRYSRHRYHGHGGYWRHHRHHGHHDGFSASFLFDLTPPPPRRVYVAPPPPVIVQPPPVVYQAPPRAYCREYTTTVLVNGRPVETFGTACLQPDGSWRIVSMN